MQADEKNNEPQIITGMTFSRPVQQIIMMLIVSGLVGVGGWFIHEDIKSVFLSNLWLNGTIIVVFAFGVLTCFGQVFALTQSVGWIERFAKSAENTIEPPPSLLAPLAALLHGRAAQMQISESSTRSILDSVATRIDEARDITRYLTNLLVFLGLLGTFYGLATTVPAIVETIRSLAPDETTQGVSIFTKLISGLEAQLGGMGTAFSSSLLGLAGSLVVGLLELFAGHGQNRFYRELEEWLSSFTQLSTASRAQDSQAVVGDAIPKALEQMVAQVNFLGDMLSRADAARAASEAQIIDAVQALCARVDGGNDLTREQVRISARVLDVQERLVTVLGQVETGFTADVEARMRLRSIDVQLLRVLEEVSAGRAEGLAALRGDLSKIAQAVTRRDAVGG